MTCFQTPQMSEIAIHSGARRIVSRQHALGAAATQHVKDPVEDPTHIDFSWPSTWLPWRDQWFKNNPFVIREIRRLHFHWLKSLSGAGRCPSHPLHFLYPITWASTFSSRMCQSPHRAFSDTLLVQRDKEFWRATVLYTPWKYSSC